ncbi:AraC family transcriptional regulator [Paenibacillus lemnae]|uniref:Helix-turn-helix transcriptional regulator n=1 Tax=Paenibacillus lemnae TaxID=1330551 RepID=A0A848MA28_PAELE|nr:helix-turn-helix domain-containing protein [Paenibacillus lemnae]NMO97020.1 helix-turn-helix transcriptional regulator [Paenibacillus lemnae]
MNTVPPTRKGKLYSRLLITITCCTVLTLLVSSLFYFVIYNQIDLKKAYQSDLSSLMQNSKEVVSMTESAQAVSFQIYRTYAVSKLMFYTNPNIYDEMAAMQELNNYLNSMPFIESIYVYNSDNERFFTARQQGQGGTLNKDELEDQNVLEVLNNFQQYRPFTPIPRTYTVNQINGEQTIRAYTYLGYDAIGHSQKINSAVVVNISSDWINKDIAAVNPEADAGKSYIWDNNQNRLLSGDTLEPKVLNPEDASLLDAHIKNKPSGYIVSKVSGKKSLVSFTSPDPLGWQYVRITPYSTITEAVSSIRNVTIWIACIIMAAGLFISWITSKMLYKPIHQIVDEKNRLEHEKRNSSYTIRQNLLRGLLQGVKPLQTPAQLLNLVQNGITFDFSLGYWVVLLKIDHFSAWKESKGNDLLVYKFAIMNIGWENGLKHFQVETVDMEDDGIAILFGRKDDELQESDETLLQEVLSHIQQSTLSFLKLSISAAYSKESYEPHRLSSLYKEVREAAKHRMFKGPGCIIRAQDIAELQTKEYVFPADKERKMNDALMSGKTQDAKVLFAEIVDETEFFPFHVVNLAISHLTMSVNQTLYAIYKNNSLDSLNRACLATPSSEHFETIDEVKSVFFKLFDEIHHKLSIKRSTKQHELVRKVNDIIHKEFNDPNLSLNRISEELGLSPIHVSRVYKQHTLSAIVDVINQVRMEQAREQLEHTSHSVVDIAQKCGYTSSSYFHRIFKKNFGVTPADYRRVKAQTSS